MYACIIQTGLYNQTNEVWWVNQTNYIDFSETDPVPSQFVDWSKISERAPTFIDYTITICCYITQTNYLYLMVLVCVIQPQISKTITQCQRGVRSKHNSRQYCAICWCAKAVPAVRIWFYHPVRLSSVGRGVGWFGGGSLKIIGKTNETD